MHKFIENIIGFSLKNHVFILFMTGVLFVAGIACYQNTPIEAYPDGLDHKAFDNSVENSAFVET